MLWPQHGCKRCFKHVYLSFALCHSTAMPEAVQDEYNNTAVSVFSAPINTGSGSRILHSILLVFGLPRQRSNRQRYCSWRSI